VGKKLYYKNNNNQDRWKTNYVLWRYSLNGKSPIINSGIENESCWAQTKGQDQDKSGMRI
jgi:hypothetical protein